MADDNDSMQHQESDSKIIWVGFNIVWSVLYERREYNHSSLF